MKKIILLLLTIASVTFPQKKYFIFLKDKGEVNTTSLDKSSLLYKAALESLTERSIERRKKVLGDDVITYDDIPLYHGYIEQLETIGIKPVNQLKWFNAVTAYLTEQQKAQVTNLSFVKEVVPVKVLRYKSEIDGSLNKPVNLSYGYSSIQDSIAGVPPVHKLGINGHGVLIGILDTGFDWKRHIALKHLDVKHEWDFVQGDSITSNEHNDVDNQHIHGTAVFSILAGYKDSVLIGPAYGASFLLAKTEDVKSETHVEEDNYAKALEWMDSLGVDITTSSLGYNQFDTGYDYTYSNMDGNTTIVTRAAKKAFQKGIITLTAAGNEGNDNWYYILAPADENNIIAVGGVASDGTVNSFSSRGPTYDGRIKPEVCALGSGVFYAAASTDSLFGSGSGTSFAAPMAAGVTALLLSAYPYLDNKQVRSIIISTADNYKTPDNNIGYGIISAKNALGFPNIQKATATSLLSLNKLFYTPQVHNESVKAHFIFSNDTIVVPMASNGLYYTALVPSRVQNEKGLFYFTYSDSNGTPFTEPIEVNKFYTYYYGTSIIDPPNAAVITVPYDYGVLSQNYPNPFNNTTTINFLANKNDAVDIGIYNLLGEKVYFYSPDITVNGEQSFVWNGVNFNHIQLPSGVYIYQLTKNNVSYSKKLIILK